MDDMRENVILTISYIIIFESIIINKLEHLFATIFASMHYFFLNNNINAVIFLLKMPRLYLGNAENATIIFGKC